MTGTEADRLSVKFPRSYKVLVQLYPFHWDGILTSIERSLSAGETASGALRAVNICRGLPPEIRDDIVRELVRDQREIRRGQQNFHTPLTEVSLSDLLSGKEQGFFSYVPGLKPQLTTPRVSQLALPNNGLCFISHDMDRDGRLANAFAAELERKGCSCWIAPRDTKRGRWNPQVLRAVHACGSFIAILSKTSLSSDRVVGEIEIAVARGKAIVPIRLSPDIEPAEFDIGLQPLHRVDWFESGVQRVDHLARAVLQMFAEGTVGRRSA